MLSSVTFPNRAPHEVQFYQDRRFLTGKVAQFVEDGLSRGERVLVIVEEATAAMLWKELQQRGVDVEEARTSRRLVRQDARAIADRIAAEGTIDSRGFDVVLRTLVDELFDGDGSLRIYGEVVNLLMKAGDAAAALDLERKWNELLAERRATLLCGYDLNGFTDSNQLHEVTRCHDTLHPAEPLADFDGVSDPILLLGELQHCDHLLESESRARRELEEERAHFTRQAELLSSHLGRLQSVTAALSEASAPDDVARAIATEFARVTSAEQAFLALPSEDEQRLVLASHVGLSEAALDEFVDFAVEAPLPAATAFRTGRALWLDSPAAIAGSFARVIVAGAEAIACLPLLVDKRRMGVVGLGYPGPREFTPSDRALLHDLCRQASTALDRSRLLHRAEQADRARDDFLAMLGHELRNPLSPIVTSLQLIRLRAKESSHGRELEVIERQVRNLVRIVDDFVDVSRITAGRVRIDPERVETAMSGRARILIVDDNVDGASVLAEGLRELGYSAMVAHDPASALHTASSLYPDFALIEIGLPSIDGYELARELRLRDTLRGLRFIAITGFGSDADRRRSKDAGFEAHLVKPVELAMVDRTLKALLQDSSSSSSRTAG